MHKFKVDENLPKEVAELFNGTGHDAVTVPEQQMAGWPDPDLAIVCRQEGRALVTLDLDFADIRNYPPSLHPGIIVLRLAQLDKRSILLPFQKLLTLLNREPLTGKLWIVSETKLRIRD